MRPGAELLPLTPPGSDLLMPDMPAESQVRHPAAPACMGACILHFHACCDASLQEHVVGQELYTPCGDAASTRL